MSAKRYRFGEIIFVSASVGSAIILTWFFFCYLFLCHPFFSKNKLKKQSDKLKRLPENNLKTM
jgi:hypothetical protein